MKTLVIDASIAIQWVVEEDGTELALALRQQARLVAPDLLVPGCDTKSYRRYMAWLSAESLDQFRITFASRQHF